MWIPGNVMVYCFITISLGSAHGMRNEMQASEQ